MSKFIDRTGQMFGDLTVLMRDMSAVGKDAKWLCECTCGSKAVIRGSEMVRGRTKSCGCLRARANSARRPQLVLHGRGIRRPGVPINPTYGTWLSAKRRCQNRNHPRYSAYGGRGIRMDDRWFVSFLQFLADMGERPEGRTLDRKNVNGNYEPGNCRWATSAEQAANRQSSKKAVQS
jgi:hypothetical protein